MARRRPAQVIQTRRVMLLWVAYRQCNKSQSLSELTDNLTASNGTRIWRLMEGITQQEEVVKVTQRGAFSQYVILIQTFAN